MDGERDDLRGDNDGRREGDEKNDARRDAKRDAYVAEISARLRHVCHHLTDAEFTRLIVGMAETKLRFQAIDAVFPPLRQAPAPVDREGPSSGASDVALVRDD
jgi:hypothetical protein